MKRVLVVEDDLNIARLIELHLRDLNVEIDVLHDGLRGLERGLLHHYDLAILDVRLPNLSGFEICKGLRQHKPEMCILMLTQQSTEVDKVLGLELGADDYLTKPFGIPEFVARVKALLRRSGVGASVTGVGDKSQLLQFGGLSIDTIKRRVTLGNVVVHLTAKEFDLLHFLASHPGRPFSRAELLDHVWGYSSEGYEHTVSSHMNRLRSKVEPDPDHPLYILTVWGVGYRFADNFSAKADAKDNALNLSLAR